MITQSYTTDTGEKKEAFFGCEHCEAPIHRLPPDGIDVCEECGIAEGFNNRYYDCETNEVVEI